MARTRFRTFQRRSVVEVGSGSSWSTTYDKLDDIPYSITDMARGPGPCYHFKIGQQANGVAWHRGSGPYQERGSHFNDNFALTYGCLAAANHVEAEMSRLSWDKLPTSSKFDLLGIIAELDDTLAILTRKFWEKLSYGSVSWGILPVVSDLMAIGDAIKKAGTYLGDVPYEDSGEVSKHESFVAGGHIRNTVSGSYRNAGVISYPGGNDILAMFDRLGFHPSLQTAWDLTPMSFLIDYVLPVGNALESLAPRGWIRAANFTGWQSAKFTISSEYIGDSNYVGTGLKSTTKAYLRRQSNATVLEVPYSEPELPTFRVPSWKQMFDIVYVDAMRARRSNPIPFKRRF